MTERAARVARIIDAALLRRWPLPKLAAGADKQARGDVLVVGGSAQIPGAVLLAATAALRAGAGRVQVATVRATAPSLGVALPEGCIWGLSQDGNGELAPTAALRLGAELEHCGALLLGPGMRAERAAAGILRQWIRRRCRGAVVLDAAALRLLVKRRAFSAGTSRGVIATPHAGEMAELWGCERELVEATRLRLAREAAVKLRVILVLKGAETFIAAPDGRVFRNIAGNSGLATAGSGDTLSGLISGLAARGAEPLQAAVWGVYLHAKAGEALKRKVGPLGYLARELAGEVPALLGRLAPKS